MSRRIVEAIRERKEQGLDVSAASLAKALRLMTTIKMLKRNGRRNWKGELLRFLAAWHALRKDLI